MFNSQLCSVLNQINGITNSVILKYPETVALAEDRSLMVRFNVASFDADEFQEVPLNDGLSDFLKIFKLFGDERKVTFNNNVINISDGTHAVDYITYDKALMSTFDVNATQFERTKQVPTIAEFSLTIDDIKALRDAGNIFKNLDNVIIEAKDGQLKLSLGNLNSFNAQFNTYSITKETTLLTKDFKIAMTRANFNKIPMSNYVIQIKYNSERDAYRIFATNSSIDDFELIMSCAL